MQTENQKKPVFVVVYDKLFEMVKDGTYHVGESLPPEPKLAILLGVSRATLRKALKLLEEDGLLKKIKGKGNFVQDLNKPMVSSLEKLGNPIHKVIQLPLDAEVEIAIHVEEASDYEKKIFKRDTDNALAIDRWYRSGGELVAYTLTLAPINTFMDLELDLADTASILNFLEEGIYIKAFRSHLKLKFTKVGDFISDRYVLNEHGEMYLIQENLYNEDDFAILLHNKHYILPDVCSLEINAT